MFSIRTFTRGSEFSSARKMGPQTGISPGPCDGSGRPVPDHERDDVGSRKHPTVAPRERREVRRLRLERGRDRPRASAIAPVASGAIELERILAGHRLDDQPRRLSGPGALRRRSGSDCDGQETSHKQGAFHRRLLTRFFRETGSRLIWGFFMARSGSANTGVTA